MTPGVRRAGSARLAPLVLVVLSVVAHLVLVPVALRWLAPAAAPAPVRVTVLADDPGLLGDHALAEVPLAPMVPEPPVAPPEPPAPATPPPRPRQLVDVAPPTQEERPTQADYYAEHDRRVEQETRTERFEVNPEVLAARFSTERRERGQAAAEAGAAEASEGASEGADVSQERTRDGVLASRVPSRFRFASRSGAETEREARAGGEAAAGAPQNDLLDERLGDEVALNTLSMPGARYFNGIRGKLNFYWKQNLDNLHQGVGSAGHTFETRVRVRLDRHGAVQALVLLDRSGDPGIDACVTEAFADAGPFPDPPPDLIAPDGNIYLPTFSFTVQVGFADARSR